MLARILPGDPRSVRRRVVVRRARRRGQSGGFELFQMVRNRRLTHVVTLLVTGASKGIGASIAKAFAAQGASVVVNYASSRAGAEAVVAEIKSAGGKAVAVHGSVAKEAEDREALDAELGGHELM